jgi:hypothetical protein
VNKQVKKPCQKASTTLRDNETKQKARRKEK